MKNKLIRVFLILILNPITVQAASLSINCDTDTVKDNDLSCTVKGNSSDIVIGLSLKITTGNNITFTNFIPASVWQGNGEEGKVELYTDSDVEGEFLIGTVNFSINQTKEGSNSNINLNNIFFYNVKGKEVSINSITKNIRIASTDNDLSSLSLNNGSLNPTFNTDTTIYSTTINSSNVKISASAHSKYATIKGDTGTQKLNYGNNNFKVNVTSESGSTKTYTINIIRPETNTTSNTTTKSSTDNKTNTNNTVEEETNNTIETKESTDNDITENNIEENTKDNTKEEISTTTNTKTQFNDKKIKNIFITIITILIIINAIRIIISGINMKRGKYL